jgi:hypothetical protein
MEDDGHNLPRAVGLFSKMTHEGIGRSGPLDFKWTDGIRSDEGERGWLAGDGEGRGNLAIDGGEELTEE